MCLDVFSQDLDDRLEGEPFRDVLSSTKHLTELGSRQLLDVQSLLLGFVGGGVTFLFSEDKVQRWDRGDTKLFGVGLGDVLGVVGTIVILSGDGGLGSGHITSDDEVSAAEVLTDDHVLDGFTWSGHVHGVWKVFPEDTWVGGFFLENLVGLVTGGSWDIVGLGRSASRVDKNNTAFTDQRIVKSACEKFVVSTMDRVTALEGNDVLVIRKLVADLSGGLAGEVTDRSVQSGDLSSHVVLSTFGGNHQGSWVLQLRGSVALLALIDLVGDELVGELNSGNWKVSLLEKDGGSWLKIFIISIENDRKTENGSVRKRHVLNNAVVGGFVHESSQRRESSVHDKFDIAQLTFASLKLNSGRGNGGVLVISHLVDKNSSVGHLLGSHQSRMLGELREGHGVAVGDLVGGHGGESRHRGGKEGSGGEELHG
mmetsp:Transcript_10450/g.25254  ORF Transcript_10450/g.25254 Transcript_10450/m.25254 type:complete len:426 (-) Transcript_10450:33-1310(-)